MLFINIFASLVLIGFFIIWKSPLILFSGQFALGAIFRTPDEAMLVNVGWFGMLLLIGLGLYRSGIRWDRLQLKTGKLDAIRAGIFVLAYFTILYFWIREAGVTDFSSEKRAGDVEGGLSNIVDGFNAMFLAVCVTILAFWRSGNARNLLIICCIVFAVIGLRAFLGSNRGLVIVPVVLLLAIRMLTIQKETDWVRLGLVSLVIVPAALYFLVFTTAIRAGASPMDGFGMLADQLSGGLGNGYSPMRDLAVIDHVDLRGAFLSPIMILAPFYGFIPRFIWADKPDVGAGGTIGVDVFGAGGAAGVGGAGIPVSVPAHFEAMLGPGGFWFGIVFVAAMVGLFVWASRRNPIVLVPLAMIGHNVMGSDLGRLGMQLMLLTFAVLVAQKLLSFRLVIVQPELVESRRPHRNTLPGPAARGVGQPRQHTG